MLDRFFRLSENHTNVRTELLAGLTTFLTMAYIIVVQPMVLSGRFRPARRAWTSAPSPPPPASPRRWPRPSWASTADTRSPRPPAWARTSSSSRCVAGLDRRSCRWQTGLGVGFLLGRDLPAALDAGRARETDGGHQPQHAQRHRRRHRTVHRADRHEQYALAAARPGRAAGSSIRNSPRPT